MKGKGRGAALRETAWEYFARKGLPNRRVEAWHYTDLQGGAAQAARRSPRAGAAAGARPRRMTPFGSSTLDGVFRPDLSDLAALPDGVTAQSLREALAQGAPGIMALIASADVQTDDAIVALNAALMQDGVILRIPAGGGAGANDRTGYSRLRRDGAVELLALARHRRRRRQGDHRRDGGRARRRGPRRTIRR